MADLEGNGAVSGQDGPLTLNEADATSREGDRVASSETRDQVEEKCDGSGCAKLFVGGLPSDCTFDPKSLSACERYAMR
jgi:hypothetical protein